MQTTLYIFISLVLKFESGNPGLLEGGLHSGSMGSCLLHLLDKAAQSIEHANLNDATLKFSVPKVVKELSSNVRFHSRARSAK